LPSVPASETKALEVIEGIGNVRKSVVSQPPSHSLVIIQVPSSVAQGANGHGVDRHPMGQLDECSNVGYSIELCTRATNLLECRPMTSFVQVTRRNPWY
jgi:hypothetical protein